MRLVDMETHAFALIDHGRRRQALALLMSPEYGGQKLLYAEGMERAINAARTSFTTATQQSRDEAMWWGVAALAGMLLSFLGWFRAAGMAQREQEVLLQALRDERDAAASASAAKSIFLANMSHELRTPLNAVIGYSEMLREGAAEDGRDSDASDHDKVLAASRTLLTLLNDLLDLSRAEAGKVQLRIEDFAVRTLVEAALATIEPMVAAQGNVLKVDIAADAGEMHSDEFRLNQCLLNLLSNAAKFTKGGEIRLSVQRRRREGGDWVDFVVADSGVGIARARLEHLFEPFVQGDAAVARAYGGTGLGLAITRTLARLLGGDVGAESELGQGSTFTLSIPAGRTRAPLRLAA